MPVSQPSSPGLAFSWATACALGQVGSVGVGVGVADGADAGSAEVLAVGDVWVPGVHVTEQALRAQARRVATATAMWPRARCGRWVVSGRGDKGWDT
ncbi:MAG: hypothetical protein IPM00_09245 [Tetrasphaera sp.]|nr:hypothetical protein [Tetrasphaera sp.]